MEGLSCKQPLQVFEVLPWLAMKCFQPSGAFVDNFVGLY